MARVLVSMSGGVDSAVAAATLVQQGHDVAGVTLRLVDLSAEGLDVSRCCAPEDIAMARAVAEKLGIVHHVLDMENVFRREVLEPFVSSYLAGETPSPCVRCNSRVKFGALLAAARELGAETLATGHYARVECAGACFVLRRPRDTGKDQTYFLFELTQDQLARVIFPLGDLTKREVRARARALDLPNSGRPDSQEVCFVPPGRSYADVLLKLAPDRLPGPGEIVTRDGHVLGRHQGHHLFTVGQRRGLGVAGRRPLFVLETRARENQVVVGELEQAYRRRLLLRDVNWIVPVDDAFDAEVQIRSRHQPTSAHIRKAGEGGATIDFAQAVLAPTPGQAAVIYQGDRVLGGGFITRVV